MLPRLYEIRPALCKIPAATVTAAADQDAIREYVENANRK